MSNVKFYLQSKRENYGEPSLLVSLHPAYLTEEGAPRNPQWEGLVRNGLDELASFEISARYGESFGWYGWQAEFRDVYCVDLPRAESMVRVLRTVQRKLAAQDKAYGSPPDFPTYCARVAKAVGATLDGSTFGLPAPRGETIWASGERYRWTDVDSLRYRINDLVTQFQKGVTA